ncbi:Uncharacterised protein [Actinobacillus pleuropneumoniae]|nr:Uncharacterised protein [Actinobacillus pleuropneumoniae]
MQDHWIQCLRNHVVIIPVLRVHVDGSRPQSGFHEVPLFLPFAHGFSKANLSRKSQLELFTVPIPLYLDR